MPQSHKNKKLDSLHISDLSNNEKSSAFKTHSVRLYRAFLDGVIDLEPNIKVAIGEMLQTQKNLVAEFNIHLISICNHPLKEDLSNLFSKERNITNNKNNDYDMKSIENSRLLILEMIG